MSDPRQPPAPASPGRGAWARRAPLGAAFALLGFAAGWLSVSATTMPGVGKLLWLPAGLGIGVLCLWGLRWWPLVVVMAALAAMLVATQPLAILAFAAAAGLEAVAVAWVMRASGWQAGGFRVRDILVLAAAAFAVALLGGTLEYLLTPASTVAEDSRWWACWLAHSLGNLLVAPLLMSLGNRDSPPWTPARFVELAVLVAATLGLLLAVFGAMGDPEMFNPLPYALFPLLLWAALRFGVFEVSALLLLAALLAGWGTAQGNGPFALPSVAMSLGSLHLYLSVASVAALALAAAVAERSRAEARARQHLQQLAQVSRALALGEMGSAIAHELNQPLAAVASYAQAARRLMAAGDTGPDVQRALERIGAQAERAGEILRRLRTFLAGSGLDRAETDLAHLVHEVVELARPEARECQTALDVRLDPALPRVQADGVQIQQVLLNLVRNACEALAEAGVPERVVRIVAQPANGGVSLAVSDTGPGVAPEVSERVFEPFFSTKPAGTGIGLALSRSIAESHAGALRLERAPEGGACFVLWLPLKAD